MRPLRNLVGCIYILLILISCDEEENTPIGGNPSTNEARDYLIFSDAIKLTGDLPSATDGALKINFKDTLYVIDNQPYKGRISVLHDKALAIAGFYVWVTDTDEEIYYDVPAVSGEGKDTVDVFYLGLDPPDGEVDLPYTVKIKIQPHGPAGNAVDEFEKFITVEQAGDNNSCEITTGVDSWRWLYTEMYNYQGDLFQVTAPWFQAMFSDDDGGYYYAKCCIEDPDFGLIEAYPGDPTREGICQFGNPLYKRVFINGAYTLKAYDELFLFKNGEFWHLSAILNSNFIPEKSRICDLFAYYELAYTEYEKIGKHDYTPGASSITMTTVTAVPKFGPIPPYGKFVNTCHLLIFTIGSEQTYKIVYQKHYDGDDSETPDPMTYLDFWFDE